MIESDQHKQSLIKIAQKLERSSQSYPKDDNGTPTKTYLEEALSMVRFEREVIPGASS